MPSVNKKVESLATTVKDLATLKELKKFTTLQVEREAILFFVKVFGSVTWASFDRYKRSFEDCALGFTRSLLFVRNAWLVVALLVASYFVVDKEKVVLVVGEVFVRFQGGGLCIVDFEEVLFLILLVDYVSSAYLTFVADELIGRIIWTPFSYSLCVGFEWRHSSFGLGSNHHQVFVFVLSRFGKYPPSCPPF